MPHIFPMPKGREKEWILENLLLNTSFALHFFWSGIPVALKSNQGGQKDSLFTLSVPEEHPLKSSSLRTPGFYRAGTSKLPVSIFSQHIPSQKAAAGKFHSLWKEYIFLSLLSPSGHQGKYYTSPGLWKIKIRSPWNMHFRKNLMQQPMKTKAYFAP